MLKQLCDDVLNLITIFNITNQQPLHPNIISQTLNDVHQSLCAAFEAQQRATTNHPSTNCHEVPLHHNLIKAIIIPIVNILCAPLVLCDFTLKRIALQTLLSWYTNDLFYSIFISHANIAPAVHEIPKNVLDIPHQTLADFRSLQHDVMSIIIKATFFLSNNYDNIHNISDIYNTTPNKHNTTTLDLSQNGTNIPQTPAEMQHFEQQAQLYNYYLQTSSISNNYIDLLPSDPITNPSIVSNPPSNLYTAPLNCFTPSQHVVHFNIALLLQQKQLHQQTDKNTSLFYIEDDNLIHHVSTNFNNYQLTPRSFSDPPPLVHSTHSINNNVPISQTAIIFNDYITSQHNHTSYNDSPHKSHHNSLLDTQCQLFCQFFTYARAHAIELSPTILWHMFSYLQTIYVSDKFNNNNSVTGDNDDVKKQVTTTLLSLTNYLITLVNKDVNTLNPQIEKDTDFQTHPHYLAGYFDFFQCECYIQSTQKQPGPQTADSPLPTLHNIKLLFPAFSFPAAPQCILTNDTITDIAFLHLLHTILIATSHNMSLLLYDPTKYTLPLKHYTIEHSAKPKQANDGRYSTTCDDNESNKDRTNPNLVINIKEIYNYPYNTLILLSDDDVPLTTGVHSPPGTQVPSHAICNTQLSLMLPFLIHNLRIVNNIFTTISTTPSSTTILPYTILALENIITNILYPNILTLFQYYILPLNNNPAMHDIITLLCQNIFNIVDNILNHTIAIVEDPIIQPILNTHQKSHITLQMLIKSTINLSTMLYLPLFELLSSQLQLLTISPTHKALVNDQHYINKLLSTLLVYISKNKSNIMASQSSSALSISSTQNEATDPKATEQLATATAKAEGREADKATTSDNTPTKQSVYIPEDLIYRIKLNTIHNNTLINHAPIINTSLFMMLFDYYVYNIFNYKGASLSASGNAQPTVKTNKLLFYYLIHCDYNITNSANFISKMLLYVNMMVTNVFIQQDYYINSAIGNFHLENNHNQLNNSQVINNHLFYKDHLANSKLYSETDTPALIDQSHPGSQINPDTLLSVNNLPISLIKQYRFYTPPSEKPDDTLHPFIHLLTDSEETNLLVLKNVTQYLSSYLYNLVSNNKVNLANVYNDTGARNAVIPMLFGLSNLIEPLLSSATITPLTLNTLSDVISTPSPFDCVAMNYQIPSIRALTQQLLQYINFEEGTTNIVTGTVTDKKHKVKLFTKINTYLSNILQQYCSITNVLVTTTQNNYHTKIINPVDYTIYNIPFYLLSPYIQTTCKLTYHPLFPTSLKSDHDVAFPPFPLDTSSSSLHLLNHHQQNIQQYSQQQHIQQQPKSKTGTAISIMNNIHLFLLYTTFQAKAYQVLTTFYKSIYSIFEEQSQKQKKSMQLFTFFTHKNGAVTDNIHSMNILNNTKHAAQYYFTSQNGFTLPLTTPSQSDYLQHIAIFKKQITLITRLFNSFVGSGNEVLLLLFTRLFPRLNFLPPDPNPIEVILLSHIMVGLNKPTFSELVMSNTPYSKILLHALIHLCLDGGILLLQQFQNIEHKNPDIYDNYAVIIKIDGSCDSIGGYIRKACQAYFSAFNYSYSTTSYVQPSPSNSTPTTNIPTTIQLTFPYCVATSAQLAIKRLKNAQCDTLQAQPESNPDNLSVSEYRDKYYNTINLTPPTYTSHPYPYPSALSFYTQDVNYCYGLHKRDSFPHKADITSQLSSRLKKIVIKPLLVAMREIMNTFRIAGEAEYIDRFVQAFSTVYYNKSQQICLLHYNYPTFEDVFPYLYEDAVFVLAFSVFMLTTDLHNKNLGATTKKGKGKNGAQNGPAGNTKTDFGADDDDDDDGDDDDDEDDELIRRIIARRESNKKANTSADNIVSSTGIVTNIDDYQPKHRHKRMTFYDFNRNVRGVNKGDDLPVSLVSYVYYGIKLEKIDLYEYSQLTPHFLPFVTSNATTSGVPLNTSSTAILKSSALTTPLSNPVELQQSPWLNRALLRFYHRFVYPTLLTENDTNIVYNTVEFRKAFELYNTGVDPSIKNMTTPTVVFEYNHQDDHNNYNKFRNTSNSFFQTILYHSTQQRLLNSTFIDIACNQAEDECSDTLLLNLSHTLLTEQIPMMFQSMTHVLHHQLSKSSHILSKLYQLTANSSPMIDSYTTPTHSPQYNHAIATYRSLENQFLQSTAELTHYISKTSQLLLNTVPAGSSEGNASLHTIMNVFTRNFASFYYQSLFTILSRYFLHNISIGCLMSNQYYLNIITNRFNNPSKGQSFTNGFIDNNNYLVLKLSPEVPAEVKLIEILRGKNLLLDAHTQITEDKLLNISLQTKNGSENMYYLSPAFLYIIQSDIPRTLLQTLFASLLPIAETPSKNLTSNIFMLLHTSSPSITSSTSIDHVGADHSLYNTLINMHLLLTRIGFANNRQYRHFDFTTTHTSLFEQDNISNTTSPNLTTPVSRTTHRKLTQLFPTAPFPYQAIRTTTLQSQTDGSNSGEQPSSFFSAVTSWFSWGEQPLQPPQQQLQPSTPCQQPRVKYDTIIYSPAHISEEGRFKRLKMDLATSFQNIGDTDPYSQYFYLPPSQVYFDNTLISSNAHYVFNNAFIMNLHYNYQLSTSLQGTVQQQLSPQHQYFNVNSFHSIHDNYKQLAAASLIFHEQYSTTLLNYFEVSLLDCVSKNSVAELSHLYTLYTQFLTTFLMRSNSAHIFSPLEQTLTPPTPAASNQVSDNDYLHLKQRLFDGFSTLNFMIDILNFFIQDASTFFDTSGQSFLAIHQHLTQQILDKVCMMLLHNITTYKAYYNIYHQYPDSSQINKLNVIVYNLHQQWFEFNFVLLLQLPSILLLNKPLTNTIQRTMATIITQHHLTTLLQIPTIFDVDDMTQKSNTGNNDSSSSPLIPTNPFFELYKYYLPRITCSFLYLLHPIIIPELPPNKINKLQVFCDQYILPSLSSSYLITAVMSDYFTYADAYSNLSIDSAHFKLIFHLIQSLSSPLVSKAEDKSPNVSNLTPQQQFELKLNDTPQQIAVSPDGYAAVCELVQISSTKLVFNILYNREYILKLIRLYNSMYHFLKATQTSNFETWSSFITMLYQALLPYLALSQHAQPLTNTLATSTGYIDQINLYLSLFVCGNETTYQTEDHINNVARTNLMTLLTKSITHIIEDDFSYDAENITNLSSIQPHFIHNMLFTMLQQVSYVVYHICSLQEIATRLVATLSPPSMTKNSINQNLMNNLQLFINYTLLPQLDNATPLKGTLLWAMTYLTSAIIQLSLKFMTKFLQITSTCQNTPDLGCINIITFFITWCGNINSVLSYLIDVSMISSGQTPSTTGQSHVGINHKIAIGFHRFISQNVKHFVTKITPLFSQYHVAIPTNVLHAQITPNHSTLAAVIGDQHDDKVAMGTMVTIIIILYIPLLYRAIRTELSNALPEHVQQNLQQQTRVSTVEARVQSLLPVSSSENETLPSSTDDPL